MARARLQGGTFGQCLCAFVQNELTESVQPMGDQDIVKSGEERWTIFIDAAQSRRTPYARLHLVVICVTSMTLPRKLISGRFLDLTPAWSTSSWSRRIPL